MQFGGSMSRTVFHVRIARWIQLADMSSVDSVAWTARDSRAYVCAQSRHLGCNTCRVYVEWKLQVHGTQDFNSIHTVIVCSLVGTCRQV